MGPEVHLSGDPMAAAGLASTFDALTGARPEASRLHLHDIYLQ